MNYSQNQNGFLEV